MRREGGGGGPGTPAGGRRLLGPCPRPLPGRPAGPSVGALADRAGAAGRQRAGSAVRYPASLGGAGATVADAAGRGHRSPAPAGSTVRVFPRRRGGAARRTPSCGRTAPGWGRRWKDAGQRLSISVRRCAERGGGPGRGWGVRRQEGRVSFLPGEDGSQTQISSARLWRRRGPHPVLRGRGCV